jgi:hypothetical protein
MHNVKSRYGCHVLPHLNHELKDWDCVPTVGSCELEKDWVALVGSYTEK